MTDGLRLSRGRCVGGPPPCGLVRPVTVQPSVIGQDSYIHMSGLSVDKAAL